MTITDIYQQLEEQQQVLVKLLNASARTPVAPNQLSDVCTKLSILNGLLGSYIPILKEKQLDKEQFVYLAAINEEKSATAANNEARIQSRAERKDHDIAKIKHDDLWKLISMAQSHIRALNDERKGF